MSPETTTGTQVQTHIDMGDILRDGRYKVSRAPGCQEGSPQEERQKRNGSKEDGQYGIKKTKLKQSDKRSQ
jgi:hypothetical protein